MYELLMSQKGHCLAQPDVMIGGVGTRIYTRTQHNQQQQQKLPQQRKDGWVWQEDTAWTKQLDEDWSLEGAKSIVQAAMERLGEDK
jgi:hypothetical protein